MDLQVILIPPAAHDILPRVAWVPADNVPHGQSMGTHPQQPAIATAAAQLAASMQAARTDAASEQDSNKREEEQYYEDEYEDDATADRYAFISPSSGEICMHSAVAFGLRGKALNVVLAAIKPSWIKQATPGGRDMYMTGKA